MNNSIKSTFSTLSMLMLLALFISSCGSRQDIVYFQDVDMVAMSRPISNYSPVIKPDDRLTIIVAGADSDLVKPYNLNTVTFSDDYGNIGRTTTQSYLVDPNGNIDFPELGKLKLAGLTRTQATETIKTRLKDFLENPMVLIRIINFKVTVQGEVRNPGVFKIENERITLLEALGLAGDLTIQGRRDNVLVVREEGDKKVYYRVNLTSEAVFNSPVYYLAQNDYIYVEPNNSRVKSSNIGPNTTTTLSLISTLVTVSALIISITK